MKYTILKHCHYSNFLPSIKFVSQFLSMPKSVVFDRSCAYVINEPSCVNKLYGFQFGVFGVHRHSYRFGWTYNRDTQLIDLYAYIYSDGKLIKKPICSVNIGEKVNLSLGYEYNTKLSYHTINFTVNGSTLLSHTCQDERKLLAFTLGFYFGGKSRAPHKMFVTMD